MNANFFHSPRRHAIRPAGLTLLELVVVVGIVAVLAALAMPRYLEYKTRAEVSAAMSNERMLADGLNAYHVDHNGFPRSTALWGTSPRAVLAEVQLAALTTPVAYVSPVAFFDPFGQVKLQGFADGSGSLGGRDDDFPFPEDGDPNPNRSMLYFDYLTLADRAENPALAVPAVSILSLGPDREDSFGAYAAFPDAAMPFLARLAGYESRLDTLYDPTNGTISRGDLPRFVGPVPLAP